MISNMKKAKRLVKKNKAKKRKAVKTFDPVKAARLNKLTRNARRFLHRVGSILSAVLLWFAVGLAFFACLDSLFLPLFPGWQAHLLSAILTVLVFPPSYRMLLKGLRRLSDSLRQALIFWSFSCSARLQPSSEKLGSQVLSSLCMALAPQSAFLWLRDSSLHQFVLVAKRGASAPEGGIPEFQVDFLPNAATGKPFFLTRDSSFFHPDLKTLLASLGTEVAIPLVYQGYLVGLLALSKRRSGASYNAAGQKLLVRLCGQAAIALSGMRLIEERKRHSTRLSTLLRLYTEAQEKAVTDGLTGLFTHAYFQEQLALHCFEANRFREPLGLMLVDIDHFKNFNDTYGHQMGDEVLRQVSKVIKETVRNCDLVARYGGEEIAVILPKTNDFGGSVLAERVREAIAAINIRDMAGRSIQQITASVGIAEGLDDEIVPVDLIKKADQALYAAKNNGRNQVCHHCA